MEVAKKTAGQRDRIELRLYELMGVRLFRKLLLHVEAVKGGRTGEKNENYHPEDGSAGALRRFSGYLLYNASLHVISLLLTVACWLIAPYMQRGQIAVCCAARPAVRAAAIKECGCSPTKILR